MNNEGLLTLRNVLLGDEAAPGRTLLIAGPVEDDQGQRSVFDRLSWPIERVRNCLEVLLHVRRSLPRVVVCERDLPDGSWKDVLDIAASLLRPPPVIVTSRLADDYLWAEVLNLGGYDVLAKPLDRREVTRTLSLAWERGAAQPQPVRKAKAASSQQGVSKVCSTA
jgi:DNA-binding NtrC family response regulator